MKLIPVTKGKEKVFAKVDDKYFDWLSQYSWCCDHGYAVHIHIDKDTKKRIRVPMHRLIMSPPEGFNPDHRNRNKLDNRENNLRISTQAQNTRNRSLLSNNTSGYNGIYSRKDWKGNIKWFTKIRRNGKYKQIGYFNTKEEAIASRNEMLKKYKDITSIDSWK